MALVKLFVWGKREGKRVMGWRAIKHFIPSFRNEHVVVQESLCISLCVATGMLVTSLKAPGTRRLEVNVFFNMCFDGKIYRGKNLKGKKMLC